MLRVHPTKRENVFGKKLYPFCCLSKNRKPKLSSFCFLLYLWDKRRLNIWRFCSFLSQIGLNIWRMCLKTEGLLKSSKKLANNCHSECAKNQRCSALFQRKSALILGSEKCIFNTVQSWISPVQRFSGIEERWNRHDFFWIRTDQRWMSLRCQLGFIWD